MPKKQKPNAFMYFVQNFRAEEEKRGRRMNIREATEGAGHIWQAMSIAERAPYEKQAKEAKFEQKVELKYTSQGIPLSQIEKENREKKDKQLRVKREIDDIVQTAFLNNQIKEEAFYFIAGNYFCKKDNDYIPAEISLSKYSLVEGNMKSYHTYLNPVKLPIGYTFTAREHSESTHRLPQPPKAFGERDWSKVLTAILEFMNCQPLDVPILYTQLDQIDVIQSILKHFCLDANEDPNIFRVYPLPQLFHVLKDESCKYGIHETTAFTSVHIAEAILQKDHYDYYTGLSCQYHEEEDVGKYCTLSMVKRWGFVFSEHISLDVGVDLIKGRHLPENEDECDDNKSFVSEKTNATITTAGMSDLTEPIKHQRNKNAFGYSSEKSICSSYEIKTESVIEYPPLNMKIMKSKKKNSAISDDDGNDVKSEPSGSHKSAYQAWSRHRDTMPREPSEATFSFSSVTEGRGRGLLVNNNKPPIAGNIGRGRILK